VFETAPQPLAAPVIDTHCHLDIRDGDRQPGATPDPDDLLEIAAGVGVTRVVQIGCDVDSARWSVAMAQTRPEVVVGVALHPNEAPRLQQEEGRDALEAAWAAIAELAVDPKVRAIGETGLDYFRTDESGREIQHESFRWHIRLAKELGKPLVIHDRESHDDVIRLVEEEGAPDTVVFHCFSGDAAMAKYCASKGWYMSFAGVVTFKNAQVLRDALLEVPDELVLVETDAPYLTPSPHRGKANGSYLMPYTVRAMADVRDVSEAAMATTLWDNAQRVFGPF
jgi:TatD DNase family protein